MLFQGMTVLLPQGFLSLNPPPPPTLWKFQFSLILSVKNFGVKDLLPLRTLKNPPWGRYGYSHEPHITRILRYPIFLLQDVWPGKADDSSVTKEFAAIAIDCLKPPNERANIHDIRKRLEVKRQLYFL